MIDFIYAIFGFVLCLSIVIYFVKKKRGHKDFILVVSVTSGFAILSLLLIIWAIEDYVAIQQGNFQIASGQCEVTKFEAAGRSTIQELHVELDEELVVIGELEDFKDVKQGSYACTVKYIEKSRTLYEIKPNKQ